MKTLKNIIDELSLKVLTGGSNLDREVEGCYIGDLLSWVMGRVKAKDAWITVMGNINAIAVAYLVDAACIILIDGSYLDEEAKEKAIEQGIVVLSTVKTGYETAIKIAEILK